MGERAVSGGLLATLFGLALVDSLNLSTLAIVALVILTAQRPVATGWAFAVGAFATFFGLTMLAFFGASFAGTLVDDISSWMRRLLFVAFAVTFVVFGVRRFRTRQRTGPPLLRLLTPATGLPLGVVATLSDLPNALPMLFGVERLLDAGVSEPTAVAALAGYTVVYALPTLVVLVAGLAFRDRPRDRVREVIDSLTTGQVRASKPMAATHFAVAVAFILLAVFVA